jgi:glycosyltransferase involved in cell wall biosynthesis
VVLTNKYSIIIPIVPKHYKYVKKLFKELETENDIIKEILLCASSQNYQARKKLDSIVLETSFAKKVRILESSANLTAGENRNRGIHAATGDLLAFLDADDSYYKARLKTLLYYFDTFKVEAIVHNYFRLAPRFFMTLNKFFHKPVIIPCEQIKKSTFQNMTRNQNLEIGIYGETNIIVPNKKFNNYKIHHGHLTIRRNNTIFYSKRYPGEDGEYCRNLLEKGINLVFISQKLSIYDRFTFENLTYSLVMHLYAWSARKKHQIFRLYFNCISWKGR